MVEAVTTRDLRENFKKYADSVVEDQEPIIVTRPKNKNVVLISEDEFNSWQETSHLLATKANREALARSIAEIGSHSSKVLSPDKFNKMTHQDD